MDQTKGEILQGTLDLMVLKVLEGVGAMHGYGIARRLEQVSENLLEMNQGTLYPALLRLQQRVGSTSSGALRRIIAGPSLTPRPGWDELLGMTKRLRAALP
jgi:hypothetical protein